MHFCLFLFLCSFLDCHNWYMHLPRDFLQVTSALKKQTLLLLLLPLSLVFWFPVSCYLLSMLPTVNAIKQLILPLDWVTVEIFYGIFSCVPSYRISLWALSDTFCLFDKPIRVFMEESFYSFLWVSYLLLFLSQSL